MFTRASATRIKTRVSGLPMMQQETDFDLGKDMEICIVVFACLCFLLSPISLVRNKFIAKNSVALVVGGVDSIDINRSGLPARRFFALKLALSVESTNG